MKTKVFVVMHKKSEIPKNNIYFPIVVGKNKDMFPKEYYRDDSEDNISNKNASYCELTAMYWIWKNIDSADNVGICHYRRYLVKKLSKDLKQVLTEDDIESDLEKYDIILPKKRYFFRKNVEEQYYSQDNAFQKDYDILRNVIMEIEPSYYETFEKVSKSLSTYLYNILISKKKTFDEYCEWLFKILSEVEKRVDITNYTQQQKRIFGFMSERLMTVYVEKNNLRVKEYMVINTENSICEEKNTYHKNNIKKIINKIKGK